jgi:queuine/archaeosine tRNA-ribosyltransferase
MQHMREAIAACRFDEFRRGFASRDGTGEDER